MSTIFLLQLIISFLVGGSFIALLSLLAERASIKNAGIIISLPSTIAISFFFISLSTSPEKVAEVAPLLPITLGSVIIFTIVYIYLSKYLSKIEPRNATGKIKSILLCTTASILTWLLINIPLAAIQFKSLPATLTGYLIFFIIGYYFLTIRPKIPSHTEPLRYSLQQKLWRASFAGLIIALSVFLAKILGPFWGGIFSSFPAVYLSTLVTLHWHYNSDFLFRVWKNTPPGSVATLAFILAAIYTFPKFGTVFGTISAYLISLVVFVIFTNRSFTSA